MIENGQPFDGDGSNSWSVRRTSAFSVKFPIKISVSAVSLSPALLEMEKNVPHSKVAQPQSIRTLWQLK